MNNFKKYLLLSLVVALLNAVVLLVFFVPRFDDSETSDTPHYVSSIEYIAGNNQAQLWPNRLLKPMPILIGAVISPIFGAKNSLVAQNVFFYFLSAFLIFFLIYHLYHNEKQAFYGTVLFVGAYPMLAYGLAPLTDSPGWFFYLLSVFISLKFIEKPHFKTVLLSGFAAGFGMLFKENVAAAPIFFFALIFIASKLSFKEKIKYLAIYGLAFSIFPLINSIIMYKLYSYSYLDWLGYNGVGGEGRSNILYMVTPLRILIEIARVLLVGWIFVLLGILKEFTLKNKERIKILVSFILASLSAFLWVYPHNRILFIAFPPLVLLGSFGLLRNHKNLDSPEIKNQRNNKIVELSLLAGYLLTNYIIFEFLLRYGRIIQPIGTLVG
jgi:hypothetical protein